MMTFSHNSGEDWEVKYQYNDEILPSQITYVGNNIFYMIGTELKNGEKELNFYISTDLGMSWSKKFSELPNYLPSQRAFERFAVSSDDIIYFCYQNNSRINLMKSEDFGTSWTKISAPEINNDLPLSSNNGVMMDISDDDEIFIGYTRLYPKIIPFTIAEGIDYFWLGQDLWNAHYINLFFSILLIDSIVCVAIDLTLISIIKYFKKHKKDLTIDKN